MQWNLRKRFLIPTLIIIVIGMGIATGVTYWRTNDALSRSIEQQVRVMVEGSKSSIDAWLKTRQLDMTNWSRQEVYERALQDSFVGKAARKSAMQALATLKSDYTYYQRLGLVDLAGNIIAASEEGYHENVPGFGTQLPVVPWGLFCVSET